MKITKITKCPRVPVYVSYISNSLVYKVINSQSNFKDCFIVIGFALLYVFQNYTDVIGVFVSSHIWTHTSIFIIHICML